MKKAAILFVLCLLSSAQAATRTSVGTGLWSAAGTWDTGVPVDTDTAVIANTHTVTFDVDQSGFAAGITLTINSGGTLIASTTAGTYYLKLQNADGTINGTLRAGTDTTTFYPANCTFTIDHNNNIKSLEVSATGHLYLYCKQPTNKYITITEAGGVGEGTAADPLNVDTDVTADWTVGDTVAIVDSTPKDVEYFTLSAINAGSIEIGAVGLAAAKSANSIVVKVTRNIRIINVAASDYAITYANVTTAGVGDHIGAEIANCYRGISSGTGYEFSGTTNLLTTSAYAIISSANMTITGALTGPATGTSNAEVSTSSANITGLIAGWTTASSSSNGQLSGRIMGCTNALSSADAYRITASAVVDYCSTGANGCTDFYVYGIMRNCSNTILYGANVTLAGTVDGSTSCLNSVNSGKSYNTLFSGAGSEFLNYAATTRASNSYFESFDHDQVVNAYKAWCKGGIVTSQTASPPTGYTTWYAHACESATYPCFRQWEVTVEPNETIIVTGFMRIPDSNDLSANPPKFQIINAFADPLVDNTQSPLATMSLPVSDGSNNDWQNMAIAWTNTALSPAKVLIRTTATHATQQVDECVTVPDIAEQVSTIYVDLADGGRLDTIFDSILTDTNEVQSKLPTNNIMGSSVKTDKDDEIDAILVDTGTTIPGLIDDMNDLSPSDVNTAVWTAKLSDFTGELTFGGELGTLDPNITAILADSNELQTDWHNGGRLDLLVDQMMADILGLNDLSSADAQTAAAAALTAYDPPTKAEMDAGLAGITVDNAAIAAAVHDEVVEGTITLRQALRLFLSVMTGKSSGGGTSSITFRDIGDTKNRLNVTVDSKGNRTAVTTRDGN